MRSRRPVASRRWLLAVTKCSRRAKNVDRSKNPPVKAKLNGIADSAPPATGMAPGAEASSPSATVAGSELALSAPARPEPSSICWKSTPVPSAVASICTIIDRTSSSVGTALPSRASVA
jgi:hypothetical protein